MAGSAEGLGSAGPLSGAAEVLDVSAVSVDTVVERRATRSLLYGSAEPSSPTRGPG